MLATPRIRVGARAGSFESTYTLGGTEAFRLDAVSWSHSVADDSDNCQPLLRCADASGEVFAEVTPPGFSAPGFPNPFGFTYTGAAAFTDAADFFVPNGWMGYNFHDFGAVPITANENIAWNQPPGQNAAVDAIWFRSAGAVSMSVNPDQAEAVLSPTVTVTLTGIAPAGSYLMLALGLLDTSPFLLNGTRNDIAVTDNVGGNALVWEGFNTAGLGIMSIHAAAGIFHEGTFLLYRVTNQLAAGDRVTVTLNSTAIAWLHCNVHVMTGLAAIDPIGPNPGSGNVGIQTSSDTSPIVLGTGGGPGTPTWVGGVMIGGIYVTPSTRAVDVMLARGGIETTTTNINALLPTRGYTQAAMPRLYLGPGDTLTALAVNSDGDTRVGDVVSDFLIWGVDD